MRKNAGDQHQTAQLEGQRIFPAQRMSDPLLDVKNRGITEQQKSYEPSQPFARNRRQDGRSPGDGHAQRGHNTQGCQVLSVESLKNRRIDGRWIMDDGRISKGFNRHSQAVIRHLSVLRGEGLPAERSTGIERSNLDRTSVSCSPGCECRTTQAREISGIRP